MWPVIATALFIASTVLSVREALRPEGSREPRIYLAYGSMLITALMCGEAWAGGPI